MLAGGGIVLAYAALVMIYMKLRAAYVTAESVVLRMRLVVARGSIIIGVFYELLVVYPAVRNSDFVDRTDLPLGLCIPRTQAAGYET
jgi:hypothetical protein